MRLFGIVGAASLATACAAGATVPVHISLAARPSSVVAGRAWTAALTVRPRSFAGAVRVSAAGPRRLTVRATRGQGTYRARLVFPAAGRWTLSAKAGNSKSRLGQITVRAPAPKPLTFTWPTSIDAQPDGSMLVVENGGGRVDRVQPATGHVTTVASGLAKPYAVAATASGTIYLANGGSLQRIDGAAAPVTVGDAGADIGPIARRAERRRLLHDERTGVRARRRRARVRLERAPRHRGRGRRLRARVRHRQRPGAAHRPADARDVDADPHR